MQTENNILDKASLIDKVWEYLQEVPDPEIPALSVVDLGIITGIGIGETKNVIVTMTPTFAGCPAIHFMQESIRKKLVEKLLGYTVEVNVDFNTAWNSNKISEKGIEALKCFGLAPPKKYEGELDMADLSGVDCPNCGSSNTSMRSPFGPTLCRALHFCFDCRQGFEQFKPL